MISGKRITAIGVGGLLATALAACGGKSEGSSPTGPSNNQTPTPAVTVLSGSVTSNSGAHLSGALVRIVDGANAGRQANTDSSGNYTITGLTPSNSNVFASAGCYNEAGKGLFINGSSTLSFALAPAPAWSVSGAGDNVFDMPTCVRRVHVSGRYTAGSSNFIVEVGGQLLVNELLGTFWGRTTYDGTLLTNGGVTQVTDSSGVQWSFTEVKQ